MPELQITYHNAFGAVQESRHVFIEAGLSYVIKHRSASVEVSEALVQPSEALVEASEASVESLSASVEALEASVEAVSAADK